ncbi:hypothetical protein ACS126_13175 [Sphingobacterium lactis]|uniref:hypothetical protein n=1 Tax=Sphingobacterium lactis TaxID=797291 RepID=UPI003EC4CF7D
MSFLQIWKETLSPKPVSKETFKYMYLSVLHQTAQQKLDEHLLNIQSGIDDIIIGLDFPEFLFCVFTSKSN